MKKTITLNIAGESFKVLFDGKRVTTPDFPDYAISYTAKCGIYISQDMLVGVCKDKLRKN